MRHFTLISLLLVFSCQIEPDLEIEKATIIQLMDSVHEAHFSKNAEQFFGPNATSWYDVRKGEISLVEKADRIPSTQAYLDNMEFLQLENRTDPVVEISNDATLASYAASVTVRGLLADQPVFWVVSWQSVLRKNDGEWRIISTANTEADPSGMAKVILKNVTDTIGMVDEESALYALANCSGPRGAFSTLIVSNSTDGRMEQRSEGRHTIFKHGKDSSFGKNLISGNFYPDIDDAMKMFAQGHELHWLAYRPLDRFKNPTFKQFTQFANQPAFEIGYSDLLERPVKFYYAFGSYVPLGFTMHTDEQGNTVDVYLEDWTEFDGRMAFMSARFIQGDDVFRYQYSDLRIDPSEDSDLESQEALLPLE